MTPFNLNVICVGNAKIDTFLTLREANNHLRFSEETNELCIKFGEKISVDKSEILLGGNAANVAVGASRLGLKAALVAEIGKDEFAQKIINTLKLENVDTSKVSQTEGQQSSFSVILNFKSERTIFSEHVRRDHNFNFENISAKYAYLTSIGDVWEKAYEKAIEFVKKTNCSLIFNPGTLQIAAGAQNLANVLSIANIIIVNKEEGQALLKNNNLNMEDLLLGLQKLGPKVVVVTDGKNGSYAIDQKGEFFKQEIAEAQVVEKTGAGDAYSSGFLSALINGKTIANAMEWGTKNSASVIGKVGAQTGLLHKSDIEKKNV